MNSHERFSRIFDHKDADRVPILDTPWDATIERWQREGMPEGVDFCNYFDLDSVRDISVDTSPQYEVVILEQTEDYKIYTSPWGATLKNWKHIASTPDFLDFKIKSPDDWQKAKERMIPSKDRIPWKYLKENYKKWKDQGSWIRATLWFGFDTTHSWTVGTERFLIALYEEPEWCVDMFNYCLDINLALLDILLDEGYKFDSVIWCDDMGYKNSQFFSMKTYRELLKPAHKKAVEWAHNRNIKAHLHSCGDVNPFIPDLIEIGIDALNPLEVKAGMNPLELKSRYGKDLVLHGGIDASLWDNQEALESEIKRIVPIMKESGGYIFSSDHSIPSSISFDSFKSIMKLVKKEGRY